MKSRRSARAAKKRTIRVPDFVLPAAIIIVIAIIIAGVYVLSTAVTDHPAGEFDVFVTACTEDDGGLDATTLGITLGTTTKSIVSTIDYCRSEKLLVEYWCDGQMMKSSDLECANACFAGACVDMVYE